MRPILCLAAVFALAGGVAHAAAAEPLALPLGALAAPDAPSDAPVLPDAGTLAEAPALAPGLPLEEAPLLPVDLPAALAHPAVAATAGGVALALVAFALYSRLARSELLDSRRRDELLSLVKAQPGISLTELASRTGLGWGTAVYHLDRLERAGFVASEKANGRRAYFPVGTVPKDARAGLSALQQDTARTIAEFVAARPGATQSELCAGLGLSASAASKQVTKLEDAGLLRREREWKTVRLHPGPKLAELLVPAATASA